MATIRLATDPDANVPAEALGFSLASTTFQLDGPSATYETDDPETISNALTHPWLEVEFPPAADEPEAPDAEVEPEPSPVPFFDVETGEVADSSDEEVVPAPEPVTPEPVPVPVPDDDEGGF